MADLEDNLVKVLEKNLQALVPQTPAPAPTPQNQTVLPSTIRQELKNILQEVLFEKNVFNKNGEDVNKNQQNTTFTSSLNPSAKCQLVSSFI